MNDWAVFWTKTDFGDPVQFIQQYREHCIRKRKTPKMRRHFCLTSIHIFWWNKYAFPFTNSFIGVVSDGTVELGDLGIWLPCLLNSKFIYIPLLTAQALNQTGLLCGLWSRMPERWFTSYSGIFMHFHPGANCVRLTHCLFPYLGCAHFVLLNGRNRIRDLCANRMRWIGSYLN